MIQSILISVKKQLGIAEEYENFDEDIILLINSAFDALHQLGVGPETKFYISDKTATWNDFLINGVEVQMAKEFVFLRVRLMFDPPSNSFVADAMQKRVDELIWRMNVDVETEWNK